MTKLMRIIQYTLIFILYISLNGCGTIISQFKLREDINNSKNGKLECGETSPFIYSGTKLEASFVKDCFSNKIKEGCGDVFIVPIDIPFTIVADTLLLPLTIHKHRKYCIDNTSIGK